MPSPLLHSVTCNFALPPLPERRRLLLICLSHFKDGWSVTQKRGGGRGSEGGGGHGGRAMQYAKQGPGSQSQRAEMRCQRCTGALMYECGEIKRVTRQTGGGWKGESSVPRESSCTSASRCYLPSLLLSLLPSLHHSSFLVSSFCVVAFQLFIYLFPHISLSPTLCCSSVSVPRRRPQP